MVSGQTMQYTKKCLEVKLFISRKSTILILTIFWFDHLIFWFLFWSWKMLLKIKIQFSGQTLRHTKQMLRKKIVRFKKIYKFYFDHSLNVRAKRADFFSLTSTAMLNYKHKHAAFFSNFLYWRKRVRLTLNYYLIAFLDYLCFLKLIL